jgi:hypothetical protein
MSTNREPGEHAARAQAHLDHAFRVWSAAEPGAREATCELLQKAINEMEGAREALTWQERRLDPELRARMRNMQKSASSLARIVDASAAFWRGIGLRMETSVANDESGTPSGSREWGRA